MLNERTRPRNLALRICYVASDYRSLARAASDYRSILARKYIVSNLQDADVVILHIEPHDFISLYKRYPELRSKYVIAYCVWEATALPEKFVRSLAMMNEIWTCSTYCVRIFARHHPCVTLIPHVIYRETQFTEDDLEYVKKLISFDPKNKYFLYITKLWDKRKNTGLLLEAFAQLADKVPNARLLIKCLEQDDELPPQKNVCCVRCRLTDSELNALYALSITYVSPHHSEGWGYTISDAMLLGRLVIASQYSGNLDYMNAETGLLIKTAEECVHPEDEYYLFDRTMRWGYPDKQDLIAKLDWAHQHHNGAVAKDMIRMAREAIGKFSNNHIAHLIDNRLSVIAETLPIKA